MLLLSFAIQNMGGHIYKSLGYRLEIMQSYSPGHCRISKQNRKECFSFQSRKSYRLITYDLNVMRQSASLNPIMVDNYAAYLIARRWVGRQTL